MNLRRICAVDVIDFTPRREQRDEYTPDVQKALASERYPGRCFGVIDRGLTIAFGGFVARPESNEVEAWSFVGGELSLRQWAGLFRVARHELKIARQSHDGDIVGFTRPGFVPAARTIRRLGFVYAGEAQTRSRPVDKWRLSNV